MFITSSTYTSKVCFQCHIHFFLRYLRSYRKSWILCASNRSWIFALILYMYRIVYWTCIFKCNCWYKTIMLGVFVLNVIYNNMVKLYVKMCTDFVTIATVRTPIQISLCTSEYVSSGTSWSPMCNQITESHEFHPFQNAVTLW